MDNLKEIILEELSNTMIPGTLKIFNGVSQKTKKDITLYRINTEFAIPTLNGIYTQTFYVYNNSLVKNWKSNNKVSFLSDLIIQEGKNIPIARDIKLIDDDSEYNRLNKELKEKLDLYDKINNDFIEKQKEEIKSLEDEIKKNEEELNKKIEDGNNKLLKIKEEMNFYENLGFNIHVNAGKSNQIGRTDISDSKKQIDYIHYYLALT